MRATPTGQASSMGPQLPPVTPATGVASLGHHMPAASGHQPWIKRGVTGDGGSVSGRINKGSAEGMPSTNCSGRGTVTGKVVGEENVAFKCAKVTNWEDTHLRVCGAEITSITKFAFA